MTVHWNTQRDRWTYNFMVRGVRYQGYCLEPKTGKPVTTKRRAKEIEAALKIEKREAADTILPPSGYTVAQAVDAFLSGCSPTSSYFEDQCDFAEELIGFFKPETPIEDVTRAKIDEYVTWALDQFVRKWIGGPVKGRDRKDSKNWKVLTYRRSPSRVNRYLTFLRGTLNKAHVTRNPATGDAFLKFPPEVPTLEEPERRPRPVPDQALPAIFEHAAQHIIEASVLTHHFRMRKSEVASRTIHDVDPFERGIRIKGEDTKGNRDEFLPASAKSWAFLEFLVAQAKRRGTIYLIAYKPRGAKEWRQVKNWYKGWMAAQRRAGIANPYRFHDHLASFSTNLRRAGASKDDVQLASRHRDPKTTERYMAVVDDGRREWMEIMSERSMTSHVIDQMLAKKGK